MSRAYERNGVWYVELTQNGRKIRRKHGRDKKLAWAAVHKYEDDKQRGKLGYVDFKPMPIDEFFGYCLNDAKINLNEKSHERYSNYTENFKGWLAQHHPKIDTANDLTTAIIQQYKSYHKKDHSYTTVNGELMYIKRCFKLCKEHGKINVDPAEAVPLYKEDMIDDTRSHFILNPEQKQALIKAAKGVYKKVFAAILNTGMRRGEITRIEWAKHVDLGKGVIKITKEIAKKGHIREIPINTAFREVLESLPRTSQYVFANKKGKKIKDGLINVNLISSAVRAGLTTKTRRLEGGETYFQYAGLTAPHDLRHTFISHLVNDLKIPIPIVQKMAGHKDLATTAEYLHVDHRHTREAVDQIKF